ncbi:MAG TPA: hypothetical protein VEN81_05880 [Planctomycetota bacterium]|nr:hypothetical protein [Planctomycetota bacterium]
MTDSDDGYIDFCHLNPSRTTTDTSDLELWLTERQIPFKHREGPAGDTVFRVPREVYARAVELWGDYRGSADYILKKHAPWLTVRAPRPPQKR